MMYLPEIYQNIFQMMYLPEIYQNMEVFK